MSEPSSPSRSPPPMRAAGLPSALGNEANPGNYARVLLTSTWKIVYDGERCGVQNPQTETREMLHSTLRDSAMRNAAREVLAAPSLSSRGVALRKSHIDVGFERPGEVEFRRQTETKASYTKQPLPKLQSASENKEKVQALQKSNIDLAFGVEKTGKHWQTDQSETLAANLERKFACEGRPEAIDGTRNYKSEVNFGENGPGESDEYVTETKCQFVRPVNPERAPNYAATRGKELREHSWDFAMGRLKTTTQWMPANKAELARTAPEKYNCEKPTVDPKLAKELRKSSVYMGKDSVEYPFIRRCYSLPGKASIGAIRL